MKKFSVIILILLIFALTACSGNKEQNPSDSNPDFQQEKETSFSNEAPEVTELSPKINASTIINNNETHLIYPIDETKLILKGKAGGDSLSGLSPLQKITYASPAKGKASLSEEKKSHSHGPASEGKPHYTVINFQNNFNCFKAYTLDTKTKDKVLYLTFDCGYEYEGLTGKILDILKEKNVPAAFFCTLDHIKKETEIISRIINEGHIVGNHSTTHPSFASISREQMVRELETTENYLREHYGYCSKFFRFPAGEYTENALDLVAGMGYVSVFWSVAYDDWDTNTLHGKDYAVKTVMSRLHDGAIILLHSVSKDNAEALGEIIDKARSQGYEFKALTNLPF